MKTHIICSVCQKNYHASYPACPYCEEERREREEQKPVQRDDLRARLEAVTAERDALLAAIEPLLEDERNDLRQTVSQMNEALEAVTAERDRARAERDALLEAAKPFAMCEWVVFDQKITSVKVVAPLSLAKLREAVRKAGGE